ncbi:MAG: FAD-binding protein [Syntrophomonadaceae bacterium]|nr:FAD-binding protein [Syntrophomonadaceae bacterium]
MKQRYDVVIIGAGPAGIFTALELFRKNSHLDILMVDLGRDIRQRFCPARDKGRCSKCEPCNITSGWSGAGAFSDGKLSLSPAVGGRLGEYMEEDLVKDLIAYADQIYLEFGARPEVYGLNNKRVDDLVYESSKFNIQLVPCPVRHLGTEMAFEVLHRMYDYLERQPGFKFASMVKAEEILTDNGRVTGVIVRDKSRETKEIFADWVVVAPGRGGAHWLAEQTGKLGIETESNEVDIGVRVEVPNSIMDHLTEDLYEAKLIYYSDTFDNKVRSFCMNPGGIVSEEHYDGQIAVVNGHSYGSRELKTSNTNFALLVSTRFTHPFNEPILYGKYIAQLANMLTGGPVMVQRLGDLLRGRRTDYDRLKKSTTIPTLKSAVPGDLSYVLPQRYLTSIVETLEAFDRIAPGLYAKNTLLYGVEVKFYSSKVAVQDNFMTSIDNLYAIGDGAGITRGLMQASVTGVVVARDICSQKS